MTSMNKAVNDQAPLLITDEASLAHAVNEFRQTDTDCIEAMIAIAGPPPLRKRQAGLAGLIRIIISQQVSTASADAIHRRFCDRYTEATAAQLLACSETDLKACGLSTPKIRTLRNLSESLVSGDLDLDALAAMNSTAVRDALTAVKGIGPWTADVYLLFCLGHPDISPAGDLALQEGVRQALNLRKRPDAARLKKISRRWKPWRAVAARIIWAYYGANRTASAPARSTKTKPRSRTAANIKTAKRQKTNKP